MTEWKSIKENLPKWGVFVVMRFYQGFWRSFLASGFKDSKWLVLNDLPRIRLGKEEPPIYLEADLENDFYTELDCCALPLKNDDA